MDNNNMMYEYKGVKYDVSDPKFKDLLVKDKEMGADFKRRFIDALSKVSKKNKKKVMEMLTDGLQQLCDELIDVIRIEKCLQAKPTTDVEDWTKDGNLLTKFKNSKQDVTVGVCFCTKSSREYINKTLGYELKTTPYTYANGYESVAVVLD